MPGIKDLKKRISSVKNTQQTTKAMKMVSAAKLRRAQDAILATRPYAKALGALMQKVSRLAGDQIQSSFLSRDVEKSARKLLLVCVTSDRGLCGAFNGSIIRLVNRWIDQNASDYQSVELAFVGKRGYDFYKTKAVPLSDLYIEFGGKMSIIKARDFSKKILDAYLEKKYDEVKFVYNEFKNVISQKPVVEDFLPLVAQTTTSSAVESVVDPIDKITLVKPSAPELMNQLLSKHFNIQVFRILLESQAGEHGARMSAMENATKNAGEMIKKLTLQFNKQRQAAITKELLEIISGSESQNAEA